VRYNTKMVPKFSSKEFRFLPLIVNSDLQIKLTAFNGSRSAVSLASIDRGPRGQAPEII